MPRKDCAWEDPKAQTLYAKCLEEIPLWRDIPRSKPKIPPTPFYPNNFDELYAARKKLQAGALILVREPKLHEWYRETIAFFDQYEKFSPDKFHPFRTNMRNDLERHRVVLRQNDYHYQIPDDTSHNLLWSLPRVSRQERARVLSRLLFLEGLEPGDFMVIRNSPHQKSVLDFPHDHVYTRIRPGVFGLFTPFPSLVEVSMAFAGEPGYTLDRIFSRFKPSH